jgi:hypothetical protein
MNDGQAKGEFRKALKAGTLKCYYCAVVAVNIDHAIPRSRGGADHPDNWRASCQKCNELKGALTEREYLGLDLPIFCNCYRPFNTVALRDRHLLRRKCQPRFRCSCLRHFMTLNAVSDHLGDTDCNSSLSSLIRNKETIHGHRSEESDLYQPTCLA